MKLIFLNAWYGQVGVAMEQFLKHHAPRTDVFCFQEADARMRELAAAPLREFQPVAASKYLTDQSAFCQATYVKNAATMLHSESLLESGNDVGLALDVEVSSANGSVHICNLHGIPQPGDKLDSPGRLQQSRELCEFLDGKNGPKIVGGDFNLLPQTRSIEIFEAKGYRNLIKEFRIATTRNRIAWEMYPHNKQYFCDYVFVSPEMPIRSFSVPSLEISDHLPLILEVEA
jgi:endonuclease/exonuclease/phosphatase family metal-dependent hydrolase